MRTFGDYCIGRRRSEYVPVIGSHLVFTLGSEPLTLRRDHFDRGSRKTILICQHYEHKPGWL